MDIKPTIGLEIHIELLTKTKGFCSCLNSYGDKPNTTVCPICLGLPGALPVLNEKVVELAVRAGLLLNCTIQQNSCFDRKNYFYPDLVKGYQITQYYHPIATNGYVDIKSASDQKRIRIERIHIEEDVGKSIHRDTETLLDFNRSGVPLIEVVTKPDFESAEDVSFFLQTLRETVVYGGISDGKLEEGSLRVDVNISLSRNGLYGVKAEIKNLNSIRNIKNAINTEIERQKASLEEGEEVKEQTLSWDEENNQLRVQRDKENSDMYMYFPEYDLPPIHLDYNYVQLVEDTMPALPRELKKELQTLAIGDNDIEFLMKDKEMLYYFLDCTNIYHNYQGLLNLLKGDVLRRLNEKNIRFDQIPISPQDLCRLMKMVDSETITPQAAKKILIEMFESKESPDVIVKKHNLTQIEDDDEIKILIDQVILDNPKAIEDYKLGKEKALGFIMGQIMKKSRGRANPNRVKSIVLEKIKNKG